jgi:flagellar biosynthesis chaperone FliJ
VRRWRELGKLVRLREIREHQARRALGEANRRSLAARETLRVREEAHRQVPELPPVLSPVQLRALQLQGIRSLELLAEAAAAYAASLEETEHARHDWRQAHGQLESAKRLERRRREEAVRRARLAAQRSLDQLMLTLREGRRWT